jgi:hypothetical protein
VEKPTSILYFEREGRANLPKVLKVVKRTFKRRPDLRALKLVIFTATGDGPALAYAHLHEYDPRIVAVTFPPDFSVSKGNEKFHPQISAKLRSFFDGVRVKVITGRRPFDAIEGLQAHNEQMQLIRDVLTLFGGSFSLGIQAVLSACDCGEVEIGERVVCMTGDIAAIVTASTTKRFLAKTAGLVVNEILCKPRNLTLSRTSTSADLTTPAKVFDEDALAKKILNVHLLPEKNPARD